jgi:hypothetical protein
MDHDGGGSSRSHVFHPHTCDSVVFFILDGSTSWSKILGNISFVVWMNIMDRTRLMAVLGPNQ